MRLKHSVYLSRATVANSLGNNPKIIKDPNTGYIRVASTLFCPGELEYTESDFDNPELAGMHHITREELQKPEFLESLKALDIVIRHQDISVHNYGDGIVPDGQIADAWWSEEEDAVVGILLIKDAGAIELIENKELWGGSLQYNSKMIKKDGKIYQENLMPEHWALTNVPRDERVRLKNEKPIGREQKNMAKNEADSTKKSDESAGEKQHDRDEAARKATDSSDESKGEKQHDKDTVKNAESDAQKSRDESEGMKTEAADKKKEDAQDSRDESKGEKAAVKNSDTDAETHETEDTISNEDPVPAFVSSLKSLIGHLEQSVTDTDKNMAKVHNEEGGISESALNILLECYAKANNVELEELKGEVAEMGLDAALKVYQRAMAIAGRSSESSNETGAEAMAADAVIDDIGTADDTPLENSEAAAETETDGLNIDDEVNEAEKVSNEAGVKDYTAMILAR